MLGFCLFNLSYAYASYKPVSLFTSCKLEYVSVSFTSFDLYMHHIIGASILVAFVSIYLITVIY